MCRRHDAPNAHVAAALALIRDPNESSAALFREVADTASPTYQAILAAALLHPDAASWARGLFGPLLASILTAPTRPGPHANPVDMLFVPPPATHDLQIVLGVIEAVRPRWVEDHLLELVEEMMVSGRPNAVYAPVVMVRIILALGHVGGRRSLASLDRLASHYDFGPVAGSWPSHWLGRAIIVARGLLGDDGVFALLLAQWHEAHLGLLPVGNPFFNAPGVHAALHLALASCRESIPGVLGWPHAGGKASAVTPSELTDLLVSEPPPSNEAAVGQDFMACHRTLCARPFDRSVRERYFASLGAMVRKANPSGMIEVFRELRLSLALEDEAQWRFLFDVVRVLAGDECADDDGPHRLSRMLGLCVLAKIGRSQEARSFRVPRMVVGTLLDLALPPEQRWPSPIFEELMREAFATYREALVATGDA